MSMDVPAAEEEMQFEETPAENSGQFRAQQQRLRVAAERAAVTMLDRPEVTRAASDTVTAAIQTAGFTSMTLMDMCLGLLIGLPGTLIQMVTTFKIFPQPAAGTKEKLAYDVLDYHLETPKGWLKLQGGVLILLYSGVIFTLLIAIVSIPIIIVTTMYDAVAVGPAPSMVSGAALIPTLVLPQE